MNQTIKSTPKMRQVYTPRVKSAMKINDFEPHNPLYFTNKKKPAINDINPQKNNNPVQKKLKLHTDMNLSTKKIDVAVLKTDTGSPVKKASHFEKNQVVQKKQANYAKDNYVGRNIRWNANNNLHLNLKDSTQNRPLEKKLDEQQKDIKVQKSISSKNERYVSAHTYRPNSAMLNTNRTNKIKQEKKQFDEKFKVAFNYLMRSNSDYLKQRSSMCNQKARPREEIFQVKRPTINTTNKDLFKNTENKFKHDFQPQDLKMSLLLSQSKVCGNSLSQQFHSGRQQKRPDRAQWLEGFKLQGPIYNASTYNNAFPDHGDYSKMVPIAVWNQHPLGMKHKQTSTNSKFYKGDFCSPANMATWNNLNPVANDFNPEKSTVYCTQYDKKQRQPIQNWPLPEHKLITSDGKFDTQMRTSLVDFNKHELNYENRCSCKRKRH